MNEPNIWQIMTGAQVSTALVLIAASLVYIAIKLSEKNDHPNNASFLSNSIIAQFFLNNDILSSFVF